MNDDKKKQLIAWLESMPWWDELPYAHLEAENEAWREIGNELIKARTERAIARTRKIYELLDALLEGDEQALRNTQEPTCTLDAPLK